ncbi:RsmB/NOP family class I SAM-dependent RNA methyltransferase [Octadecabacter ascidiaceicola]|uniref:Ribosomal RNA small subunit methyltransferase B n=1 Tax=Octadecabacter ascidiaceicola TaxID=1655543 RepID=A0A238JL33_9RHOB|nr:RsmB/NOP family class I SAM-dependent RNA methyltransferase [Octadecabacter ascidiaceicola]SMX31388.1 Ribosomal RNA small subunit methyltransferase B [Octadecabacter ascidiaceicola]
MTPAARVAAAIEVLDEIFDGATPEKALTGWGRSHRFAGSKDRAAIRDHVFQALRCKTSYGWIGGAASGRGVMLGAMRVAGQVNEMFSGVGHAPNEVEAGEEARSISDAPRWIQCDMPEWMLTHFDAALGAQTDKILETLKSRAGVFLRVNAARSTTAEVIALLADENIVTVPVEGMNYALQVVENERRIALSRPYADGLIELQDTSSQHAILALNLTKSQRVLDLCAGGGGKALAMAAQGGEVTAHDIDPNRMVDIAPRADRAGVKINTAQTSELAKLQPFDVVFVDAPCSGSGTWRRNPAAKWELTEDRLKELTTIQDKVLLQGAQRVRTGGTLVYATCSVFDVENGERVQSFMKSACGFSLLSQTSTAPHLLGDGFYFAEFTKDA